MGDIQSSTPLEIPEEEMVDVLGDAFATELGSEGADTGPEQTEVEAPAQAPSSTMGRLPVEDWDYQQPKRGEIRTGVILAITDQEIIVDVGAKRDGIVPLSDLERVGPEEIAGLKVGDKVPVCVLRPEDQDGNLLVSLYQARQEKDWVRAKELNDSGEAWEGQVIGYNKGGLVIPLGGIRGFLPASQVADFRPNMTADERLARLSSMVGENLLVKVIELNRRKHRLILSSTVAQREWRQQQRERLLSELREGEVRRGTVSSLCPFGAFVDLGGADGLIHLSELSWRRVRHPKEELRVGDQVDVLVLKLDREHNRIGLSRKRLQAEPWALIEDTYELGQLVEGVVTNVVDFGAFAEIESSVEGLVHISELTDKPISHPREVVRKGDRLLLRIIRIDTRRKRLGLSRKRVLESEWEEWAARTPGVRREPPPPAEAEEPAEFEAEELAAEVEEVAELEAEVEEVAELEAEEVAAEVEEVAELEAEEVAAEVEEVAEELVTEVEEVAEFEAEEPAAEAEEIAALEAEEAPAELDEPLPAAEEVLPDVLDDGDEQDALAGAEQDLSSVEH